MPKLKVHGGKWSVQEMSIGQTMLTPSSESQQYNNTTLDLRFVVSKVRGFIYIQWLATVGFLRYLYQQHKIFGHCLFVSKLY